MVVEERLMWRMATARLPRKRRARGRGGLRRGPFLVFRVLVGGRRGSAFFVDYPIDIDIEGRYI